MITGVIAALVTAMVLGLWFQSTRGISIAAAAALTMIYPVLLVLILIGTGIAAYFHFIRK
jgi:hypothetical protein